MIPIHGHLTCAYTKYIYPLFAGIHLQYSFHIHCEFDLWITTNMNIFYPNDIAGPTVV